MSRGFMVKIANPDVNIVCVSTYHLTATLTLHFSSNMRMYRNFILFMIIVKWKFFLHFWL